MTKMLTLDNAEIMLTIRIDETRMELQVMSKLTGETMPLGVVRLSETNGTLQHSTDERLDE